MRRTRLEDWICEVEGISALDRGTLDAIQLRCINALLAREKARGGFYKGLPERLDSLAELRRLPFTTPEQLAQNAPGLLLGSQAEVSRIITGATSGTTGPSKRIFYTQRDIGHAVGFFAAGISELVSAGEAVAIAMPFSPVLSCGRMISPEPFVYFSAADLIVLQAFEVSPERLFLPKAAQSRGSSPLQPSHMEYRGSAGRRCGKRPALQSCTLRHPCAFSLCPCPYRLRGLYHRVEGQRIWCRQRLCLGKEQKGETNHQMFCDWMRRTNLSQDAAATALGISPRTVRRYATAQRSIPRRIWLACPGWEAIGGLPRGPLPLTLPTQAGRQ